MTDLAIRTYFERRPHTVEQFKKSIGPQDAGAISNDIEPVRRAPPARSANGAVRARCAVALHRSENV